MGRMVPTVDLMVKGLVVTALAFGASSCATTKQSEGIQRVDDLVTRVEAVHLEAELSKQAVYDTILALRPVITPTEGDPAVLFEGFVAALDTSEQRAEEFARTIAPMEQSARQVFAKWEQDLRAFTNDAMRDRSRDRLLTTRTQYDAVIRATKASNERFDDLNGALRDIALFLSHDFNAASVAAIEGEALSLRDQAKELGQEFERCMSASERYVREAAPLGVAIQPVVDPTTPAEGPNGPTEGSTQQGGPTKSAARPAPRR